jgi:hypothetical protein
VAAHVAAVIGYAIFKGQIWCGRWSPGASACRPDAGAHDGQSDPALVVLAVAAAIVIMVARL